MGRDSHELLGSCELLMHFINEGNIDMYSLYFDKYFDKEWRLKRKCRKYVDDMWRHRDIGNITRI